MNNSKNQLIDNQQARIFDASEILRSHGIYPTAQRVCLANMLLAKNQHMTAEQIYEGIRNDDLKVSQATVYNTLGLLVQKGLLHEIFVDSTKTFYDSNIRPHQHFYNVDTGALTDIRQAVPTGFLRDELPSGVALDSIDVIVRIKNLAS